MAQPGVLRARQPRVAAGLEFAVLGAAHANDALVEGLGPVEAIERDRPPRRSAARASRGAPGRARPPGARCPTRRPTPASTGGRPQSRLLPATSRSPTARTAA